jgi:hypothetical protein
MDREGEGLWERDSLLVPTGGRSGSAWAEGRTCFQGGVSGVRGKHPGGMNRGRYSSMPREGGGRGRAMAEYARPQALVETQWIADQLKDPKA